MRATPGLGVVALAVVLPWTTALRFAAAGREEALTETPLFLFSLGAVLLVALLAVVQGEPWLGAFVAYTAAQSIARASSYGLETAQWIAIATGGVLCVRALPPLAARIARHALVASGLLQIGYLALQAFRLDPLFVGFAWTRRVLMLGTLGNENFIGGYLALLAPLATPFLAPLFLVAILVTTSTLGLVAASLGLLVAYRRHLYVVAPLVLIGALAIRFVVRGSWYAAAVSGHARWDITLLGLREWITHAPVFGFGFGAWLMNMPSLQLHSRTWISDYFAQAHNEVVQLAFEGGLVALALLAGFLYQHRAMWKTPYAGALVALSIESVGMFPFHLAIHSAAAVVILGLAIPRVVVHRAGLHVPARMLRFA